MNSVFLKGGLNPGARITVPRHAEKTIGFQYVGIFLHNIKRGKRRTDALKDLEGELNYMVEKKYLGKWENLGYKDAYGFKVRENALPSKCGEPFKCILKLTPPEWLQREFKQIRAKRETLLAGPLAALDEPPEITAEEFSRALANSGLTQKQFGNTVGMSQQMVAVIKAGRKRVSPKIAEKVKEKFGDII
jgi:DNA-binding transcriptional regulator YiaG